MVAAMQYRINQQAASYLVRQCAHPAEKCGDCPYWADCLPLGKYSGKNAAKQALALVRTLNPHGRLAREHAADSATL